ncbi:hypothetical protein CASFOL_038743 [Castilleja foliolosa]|uniref:KIB1-4 beta-propeller domain-containing protein n=1 Tax=Castilleja foliolosa TaxID=1961234 RepID=A0ABD3BNY5_9LAMI
MASLLKRCWTTRFSILCRISDPRSTRNCALIARMMMSTGVNSSPTKISPWLMLPPLYEEGGGDLVYKFYNLSEGKEESFRSKLEEEEIADAKFVGSSQGWLALFNQRNNHLFLYNPITNRHIKLPSIETLPDPMINLTPEGRGNVSKLILSSSPDDNNDECIAMMTFGPGDRLAFCHPRRSTEWTPIGKLFFKPYNGEDYDNQFILQGMEYGRAYDDFVFCRRLKLFTCVTQFEIDLFGCCIRYPTCDLEDWDLSNPHSPISTTCSDIRTPISTNTTQTLEWMNQNLSLLDECRQIPYLVFAEQHNQLFIVIRFVMDRVAPDGSYVDVGEIPYDPINRRLLVDAYPYKTIDFCVLKVDYDGERNVKGVRLVEGGSLDGLTMFIGKNHSFAVSAAEFPKLKPNSIYFTDANKHANSIHGGRDIGIFDNVNKALSPCYCYTCVDDVPSSKRIAPPLMWFTPSLY